MPQATLRTERLTLTPLSDEHLGLEADLDADPEVMRYLGPPCTDEETRANHRRRLLVAERAPGLGYWAGSVRGEAVGWWVLAPYRAEAGAAAVGYRLLPRHWRRGLASEGARRLLRHCFEDLNLTRVTGETMAVNGPSRATMTSLGMRHVQTYHLHPEHPLPGTEQGEVVYAITRAQWREDTATHDDGRAPWRETGRRAPAPRRRR